jgi:predicted nucleic acid binding AN1-type Zn finger protein
MECAQARKGEKQQQRATSILQTSDRDPTMTPNRLAPVAQQTSLEQAGLPAQLEVEDVRTHMQNVSKIRKLQMQKPFLRVRLRSKRIEKVEVEDVKNE